MTRLLPLVLLLAVSACASAPPSQLLLDAPTSTQRIPAAVRSVELREVSLPDYAGADTLSTREAGGALTADRDQVWADTPARGTTLALARNLAAITGARVAAEPWPFSVLPDVSVKVTAERFLATIPGGVELTGSYAVAPVASAISDRDGRFNITVPLAEGASPAEVAAAHGRAVEALAVQIARSLAR